MDRVAKAKDNLANRIRGTRNGQAVIVARKAVKEQEQEAKAAKRTAQKAQQGIEKKRKMLLQKQKDVAKMLSSPTAAKTKKPAARNDLRLVNAAPTPRKIAQLDGNDWLPPTRNEQTFAEPGALWKAKSICKVKLLITL